MDIKDGRYQIEAADADLSYSRFERVTLARFGEADLSGATIEDVRMKQSTWSNVDLSGLTITNANLSGASIAESCVAGMTIDGVRVSELMAAYRAGK